MKHLGKSISGKDIVTYDGLSQMSDGSLITGLNVSGSQLEVTHIDPSTGGEDVTYLNIPGGYNNTYTQNGIYLSASPQAIFENGLRISTTTASNGTNYATVGMGPLMAEAFQNALKVGTNKQHNTWDVVAMGYGTSAIFWRIGRICGFTMNSIVGNYGNATMAEKIPEKYRPKHATSFVGQCINSGNFTGGFIIRLASDGVIEKRGTGGYQEYHCSGVYLAQNDL